MVVKGLFGAWKIPCVIALSLFLLACGGGGSSDDGANKYTISGTVSGLETDYFELYFSYGVDRDYTEQWYESQGNEDFTLDVKLPAGTNYYSGISRQPQNPLQACIVQNRSGTVLDANITNFNINCYNYNTLDITVNGLTGYALEVEIDIEGVLVDLGQYSLKSVNETFDVSSNSNKKIFDSTVIADSQYSVTILKQPKSPPHRCIANNASGLTTGNALNIEINCVESYKISGTVNGLSGDGLVIQNNGQDSLSIADNGAFTFEYPFPINSSFDIAVSSFPTTPIHLCKIVNGSGVINGGDISNVLITCYVKPVLNATALNAEVILDWPDISADSYNVYYSTDKNFDPVNYTNYANGAFMQDVTSPLTVSGLENKKGYYFVLEAKHNINLPYSEKAGVRPDNLVFDGTVNSITTNTAGDVFIGGRFAKVSAASGQGIPLSTHNRSLSMADYPLVSGKVTASVSDGSGGWYIGGDFASVDGVPRGKLAHILSDGTLDSVWHPDVDGVSIKAIYYLNNVVYVGGSFTTVDGNPHQNFVAIGTEGSIKPWNLDADGEVHAFSSSGSVVYMGGNFTTVGGTLRSRIAAFDHLGVLTSFDVDISGGIYCMQVYKNTLYIAGRLNSVAGISASSGVIALNLDGTLTGWNSGNKGGIVRDLLVHNNIVFFAGQISSSGSIAAVHIDGTPIGWNTQITSGYAEHLAVIDNKLIAAGNFQTMSYYQTETPDLNRRANLAAYNLSNSAPTLSSDGAYYEVDLSLHSWNPAIDKDVTSVSASGDSIYIGGMFNGLGGVSRKNLASLNADGTLSDWNPEADNTVNSLVEDNGTIYVGGGFSQIGQYARDSLAAIDSNGIVTDWNPVLTGLSTSVYTLFKDNNTIYIGGYYTGINGQNRANLASVDVDGTLLDWAPTVNSQVKVITKNNGNIYIGGSFGAVNELSRSYIASFDSLGDLTNWAPDITNTFNGWVYPSVNTILPVGNTIYFAGHFTSVNGSLRNHVAAVDDSGVLGLWNPDINHNDNLLSVYRLAYYQNEIVIGGKFSGVGSSTRNSLALVGEDGVLNTWDPDVNGFISTLHVSSRGALFIGGGFTGLSYSGQSNFSMYDSNGVLQ